MELLQILHLIAGLVINPLNRLHIRALNVVDEPVGDLFLNLLGKSIGRAAGHEVCMKTLDGLDERVVLSFMLSEERILCVLHKFFFASKVENRVLGQEVQSLLCLSGAGGLVFACKGGIEVVDALDELFVLAIDNFIAGIKARKEFGSLQN